MPPNKAVKHTEENLVMTSALDAAARKATSDMNVSTIAPACKVTVLDHHGSGTAGT